MPDDVIHLDNLPDEVQASIEARDRALAALGSFAGGLGFAVDNLRRWIPGGTVTVAFLGGTPDLHRDIAGVAEVIDDACNLTLDFGRTEGVDGAPDTYRTWSEDDEDHAADIRVSFDQNGNFSLVGTDSRDPSIGAEDHKVGGRPYQRSMNFGGFHIQRPSAWKGTVLHEFLHALSFHHEHANFLGPCQQDFRWEDDFGYAPTRRGRGVFVTDPRGRRPGIYTYLSGFPNHWPRSKVDHNLRAVDPSSVSVSAFDRASVMLYRFPSLFYRTPDSDCAPSGDGQTLSDGDRAGLQHLYPGAPEEVQEKIDAKTKLLEDLEKGAAPVSSAPSSVPSGPGSFSLGAPAAEPSGDDVLSATRGTLRQQLEGNQ